MRGKEEEGEVAIRSAVHPTPVWFKNDSKENKPGSPVDQRYRSTQRAGTAPEILTIWASHPAVPRCHP